MPDGPRVTEPVEQASDETKKGSDAWKQGTKAIERVISVALTINQSKTAKAIAEEAGVAEQTARDHLSLLQELSIVGSTTARGVTKYYPDAGYLRFRAIARMTEEYSRDELLDLSQEMKERDKSVKEQYDVETPDDLRFRAVSDEVDSEEMTELRQAASEWETVRHDLSLVKQAYEHYEEHSSAGTSTPA